MKPNSDIGNVFWDMNSWADWFVASCWGHHVTPSEAITALNDKLRSRDLPLAATYSFTVSKAEPTKPPRLKKDGTPWKARGKAKRK